MDVSIIVVTYNSAKQIKTCLQSLVEQTGLAFEIIVADNASADTTLKELEGFETRVIANSQNSGFGTGCNLGFAASFGRYIYLLNPDAYLVGTKALDQLCQAMDVNPQWGMAGTKVCFANSEAESPPASKYPAQKHVRRDFSALPGKIAWISGASMIVRRNLYEKLNGFDPGFFLYSEETDFCLRMREIGFEIGYIPEVVVRHIGGASEDTRDPYEVATRKMNGLLRFRQKHYPPGDCIFLAKRDLQRARFRMLWNGMLARWWPAPFEAWKKYRQYRGILEVSKQYLSSVR